MARKERPGAAQAALREKKSGETPSLFGDDGDVRVNRDDENQGEDPEPDSDDEIEVDVDTSELETKPEGESHKRKSPRSTGPDVVVSVSVGTDFDFVAPKVTRERSRKAFKYPLESMSEGASFLFPHQALDTVTREVKRAHLVYSKVVGKEQRGSRQVEKRERLREFRIWPLSAEQFAKLSNEQLKSVFEGVGQKTKPVVGEVYGCQRVKL